LHASHIHHRLKPADNKYKKGIMIANDFWTPQSIESATAELRRVRPAYAEMLDFYGPLFALQENGRLSVSASPVTIADNMATIKRKADLPLLGSGDFPIDHNNALKMLCEICSLARRANPDLATAAANIEKALQDASLDTARLFGDLDDEAQLVYVAGQISVAPEMLATLAYHAARPSILVIAEQLRSILRAEDKWRKGYCPLCGSAPVLALLDAEGHKRVCCGFCWHEWLLPRLSCPFCETTDSEVLHYFFSEQEPEYRVDVCDGCSNYIKTVDTRHTIRKIYPALEAVATLHLDMKAQSADKAD
jgi:FdhE protein